ILPVNKVLLKAFVVNIIKAYRLLPIESTNIVTLLEYILPAEITYNEWLYLLVAHKAPAPAHKRLVVAYHIEYGRIDIYLLAKFAAHAFHAVIGLVNEYGRSVAVYQFAVLII